MDAETVLVNSAYVVSVTAALFRATVDGEAVATIRRHGFVGEMSLLSGAATTATVRAVGQLSMRRWSQARIHALDRMRPDLASALWRIVGQDLATKLNR